MVRLIREDAREIRIVIWPRQQLHEKHVAFVALADAVSEVRAGLVGLQRDRGVASEDVFVGVLGVLKHV